MKSILLSILIAITITHSSIIKAEKKGIFGNLLDDFNSSGVEGAYEGVTVRNNIREWYNKNRWKLKFNSQSETTSCKDKKNYNGRYTCTFKAELSNKTNDEITGIVINLQVFNKSTKSLVSEELKTFEISIYPTVTKNIEVEFISEEVANAKFQLGKDFSWNYKLIAFFPKRLHKKRFTDHKTNYDWVND